MKQYKLNFYWEIVDEVFDFKDNSDAQSLIFVFCMICSIFEETFLFSFSKSNLAVKGN